MDQVSRYGKIVARPGHAEELAGLLLKAAGGPADDPSCLLYMVNRQKDDPDTFWVTELWRSQADLDAVLARVRGSAEAAALMEHVASSQMVELDLLGGKGPAGA